MSIFKNILASSEDKKSNSAFAWNEITSMNQLDNLTEDSSEKPVIVFKHSTRCSISRMALRQFEQTFDLQHKFTPYYLDLLENREISNEISSRFKVVHQSPQLIVIKEGKAIYNASHENIEAKQLEELSF